MATMKLGSKAELFQLQGQKWICTTDLVSDIAVEVGEISFHLHKFPLLNRSGLLQKLISELHTEDGRDCVLELHDIPGGAKAFELVVKFCYDVKIELNSLNVVYLRCAAEYLCMTEDYITGNLIAQTENSLNQVFGNWKDSIKALKTCEDILPHSEDVHIVTRCINSLATKACADTALFGWPIVGRTSGKSQEDGAMWNGITTVESPRSVGADWWYEDACFLTFPLYKRLILAMESRGMKPESVAGSLMLYAKRYLPGLDRSSSFRDGTNRITAPGASLSVPSESDQRVLLEEVVGLLPMSRGVASTKFLLGLLRTAMILHASPSCIDSLERRIGCQLDEAAPEDILIPNMGYTVETLYDIECVQRILDHFMSMDQSAVASTSGTEDEGQLINSSSPSLTLMTAVAKLLDGYLAEVAPDVNLKLNKFQSLAGTVPHYARQLDDGIYRAIDIYLKTHPWLTDSEREQLCRLMNCQKLSLEACTHAAQNERLPLRVVVQVLFFEQLRLRTSMSSWFFDNMESSHAPHGSLELPKSSNNDGLSQTEITEEREGGGPILGVDDMKLRVLELEKECLSMKEKIENLGKTKNYWNTLQKKFGIRLRYQYH